MSIFIALLAIVIALIFYFLKYQQSYWRRRGVPHDEPSFPMGALKEWRHTKSFYEVLAPVYEKFKGTGPFCGIYFLIQPVVFVLDLELIKKILIKDFSNFQDRGVFHNEVEDPLTGNLFQLDGPKWSGLRKKLSPTFTSGKMKFMFPTVVEVAQEFIKVMGEKSKDAPDNILEITDLQARYTADVIGSCAFGIECNSLRNPNAEFVKMGRKALIERRHGKLVDTFMESYPRLARKLNLCSLTKDVHDFYMGIVRETVEYRERNEVKRNDFMNILLEMKNKNGEGDGLTVEEIAAQAFIFFLAGFETSSTTMGFALYELARQPEIQARLRREINEVLERHNNAFTYEAIHEMKYLDQVVSETLRKYPVLPWVERIAKADYDTGDSRYLIEKNMPIVILTYGIHHDPEYYPEPDRFDPERFTEEEINKRPSCTWLPFGDGPRNCIGLRFGKMQAFVGLALLLKNFKFSFAPQTQTKLSYNKENVLLSAEHGIHLRVEAL
ncbi:cytochrome P450 6a22-like [Rhagoletis pomonella]|uniref:cytochrome P450 6a22-like n=1 Tax=Rhagoletis pomonella TaxID=28610 RepID=UPI00177BAB22|nr:cytochrome P450 6a22-like [Rhagoletis pomonella]